MHIYIAPAGSGPIQLKRVSGREMETYPWRRKHHPLGDIDAKRPQHQLARQLGRSR